VIPKKCVALNMNQLKFLVLIRGILKIIVAVKLGREYKKCEYFEKNYA
jgi:hypothetical protein